MEVENIRDKMKTSEFKDVKAEKIIIAGMLKYDEVVRKCSESLNAQVFSSNRCMWIYQQIVDFYDKNAVIMDTNAFVVHLERIQTKDRNPLLKLWKGICKFKKKIKLASCFASMMRLSKLYEARVMEIGMSKTIVELTKAINGGEEFIDRARENYLSISDKLGQQQIFTTITDPINLYDDFKRKHLEIQKNPEKYLGTPTGIIPLDNIMGGLRPSEFGLVTAGTGVGKSIILGDFAFTCFLSHGNVLYVTIEMPESQLRERFYCRLSSIKYDNFRKFTLNEGHWKILDRKVEKFLKEHPYKFAILDIPQSCTVKTLKNEIETYIKRNGAPRLIVIDYLNIIQGGFDWTKQLENAVGLKQQIARYFKIATWSANQLTGSKHGKEHVRIEDMGFAKNIADNVDVGIGIGLTDSSENEGIFNFDFTKTRDFQGKSFIVQADRSRMTFTRPPPDEERLGKKMKFKEKNKIGGVIL